MSTIVYKHNCVDVIFLSATDRSDPNDFIYYGIKPFFPLSPTKTITGRSVNTFQFLDGKD